MFTAAHIEEAQNTKLHVLMTQFVRTQCPHIAAAVAQHIQDLMQQPLSTIQYDAYNELSQHWQSIADDLIAQQIQVKKTLMQGANLVH